MKWSLRYIDKIFMLLVVLGHNCSQKTFLGYISPLEIRKSVGKEKLMESILALFH